jgi:hypothetical protein
MSKNVIRWDDLLPINAMLYFPATYDGADCKITPLTEIAQEFYKKSSHETLRKADRSIEHQITRWSRALEIPAI